MQFIQNWDGQLSVKKLGSIPVMDSEQTVLSLYVNSASLRELGDIESLGIPIKNVSKRKAIVEQLKEFHEKLTVLPDGRYEVKSPWKLDSRTNLTDNKELALQRQESAILRARNKGMTCFLFVLCILILCFVNDCNNSVSKSYKLAYWQRMCYDISAVLLRYSECHTTSWRYRVNIVGQIRLVG
ncbi:hypothetical protein AVEN_234131-1 [Araneus ventricosus]|uniref:Uncharacterized protein n=1 Tax=Araneus ventricosus TaxID=182803 RepID=A0A4Y2GL38_ARAVE|nr:hypothetical protein AVEN_234131-1 [Araneus ventricosus]